MRTLPGVRDAFVRAVPGAASECRLAALVEGDVPDARVLRAALREKLPAWKIPARVTVTGRFPVTSRGKPDSLALLRLLAEA